MATNKRPLFSRWAEAHHHGDTHILNSLLLPSLYFSLSSDCFVKAVNYGWLLSTANESWQKDWFTQVHKLQQKQVFSCTVKVFRAEYQTPSRSKQDPTFSSTKTHPACFKKQQSLTTNWSSASQSTAQYRMGFLHYHSASSTFTLLPVRQDEESEWETGMHPVVHPKESTYISPILSLFRLPVWSHPRDISSSLHGNTLCN